MTLPQSVWKDLKRKYLFREKLINLIKNLIFQQDEEFPAAIYIYGHSGTGKTSIIKDIIHYNNYHKNHDYLQMIYINCVELYTINMLLERILNEIIDNCDGIACDTLEDLIDTLHMDYSSHEKRSYVVVMDNAEKLRNIHPNILPFLLRLRQLTHLNVCIMLIGQIPFEKYYCRSGLPDNIITIHCAQYTKCEILHIIGQQFNNIRNLLRDNIKKTEIAKNLNEKLQIVENINEDFFRNYLNIFLSVPFKICRDVPELKIIACTYFTLYIDPILNDGIQMENASHLWRNCSTQIRSTLATIYMRYNNSNNNMSTMVKCMNGNFDKCLDLPYYGKYLLIAAYLASHKSAKEDRRLFVKKTTKTSNRAKLALKNKDKGNIFAISVGPKSFTIDRLLAIFYAIQNDNEKVTLNCNLLSQLSTLIHLKLIDIVSGESNMDESTRLQCKIDIEYIAYIGKCVGFNVCGYF